MRTQEEREERRRGKGERGWGEDHGSSRPVVSVWVFPDIVN